MSASTYPEVFRSPPFYSPEIARMYGEEFAARQAARKVCAALLAGHTEYAQYLPAALAIIASNGGEMDALEVMQPKAGRLRTRRASGEDAQLRRVLAGCSRAQLKPLILHPSRPIRAAALALVGRRCTQAAGPTAEQEPPGRSM